MFQDIGVIEAIIIIVVLFILFGTKKLSGFAEGLGEADQDLKKTSKQLRTALTKDETKAAKPKMKTSTRKRSKRAN